MKKRQKKSIREVQGKDQFSGEQSPYWNYLQSHQRIDEEGRLEEDEIANPDILSEDDHLFHRPLSEEGEFKLQIVRDAIKKLSPQQKRVLQLCGFDGMTMKEAAKELGLKIPTVQDYLQTARAKILQEYERAKASPNEWTD